jgi:peptidoglycan-N-acetylglucosamine deacetylase
MFAPSFHCGPADRPRLALTFDDGPSESTPELLDVLARHDVPATFFQCGVHVRRLPEIARAVLAAGHELGNHTNTHPMLAFATPSFMAAELLAAQQAFADVVDHQPRLFRPPYGVRWPGLGGVQRRLGLTSILWTVIGQDWRLTADAVADRVTRRAGHGGIVCLHDGRALKTKPDVAGTIRATDVIIARLADRGFQFTTVTDLLCLS